ncbi:MAG TPA: hypothetical protein VNB24_04165 [Acidimicrobiales bacterium]|nr:hypothetical protein [Acidimicrobiales bacterium]
MEPLSIALFVLGYPVAIAVILRWFRVVRERRMSWFAAHTLAVGAIVLGHAVNGRAQGVVTNGAWLVISVVWYTLPRRAVSDR